MLSQTNFFRVAARYTPRLQSTPATFLGVGCSRLFSSTAATRDDAQDVLISALEGAQVQVHAQAHARAAQLTAPTARAVDVKPLPRVFVYPQDFRMKTRLGGDSFPRRPMALGPPRAIAERTDFLYQSGIDPVKEAMNSSLMSAFVTDMGKIRSRGESSLTWKSQRRVGKAIRRAKMMGIIPVLSRRPLKFPNDT